MPVRRNVGISSATASSESERQLGLPLSNMPDTADYRGHSAVLHVNPVTSPFGNRGLSREPIDVGADACFWDIYRHAWNLFKVILELFGRFGEARDVQGWKPPTVDRFTQQYEETMQMQGVMI